MNLDPRTLLFSLILVNAIMVLSLFVASPGGSDGKREGMGKWALAILLETLTWVLVAARGWIPDAFSIVVANMLKAGAHALILAAICEFQRRSLPRWQYFVPVLLTLLMTVILVSDIRGRFIWGSVIYGLQMVLIIRVLLSDAETRAGRAWRLMLGGVAVIILVLGLRAFVALSGYGEFAQPQNTMAPHWVQIVSFVAVMATALLGSIGFVLMVKERADRGNLHLAMTDSLTGISNRRALMESGERMLTQRGSRPMALLMIDVDFFKRINDVHGHQVGDEVLREIANRLSGRLRRHDVLGRYGGEEFCVVAPDINAEGALILAESLREIIAATPMLTERGEISVSVSIGVSCCFSDAMQDMKAILTEADEALYAAKESGRNRVICSSQSEVAVEPVGYQHILA